jgi:hypothetical protein
MRLNQQGQRPVEARAELGRYQVVGLPLGAVGRRAAAVGQGQVQAQRRRGQHQQPGDDGGDGAQRVPGDEPGPPLADDRGGAGALAAGGPRIR